jgi:hypothetical protein
MSEWCMEPRAFTGTLGIQEHKASVSFTVGLDKAGHAHIEFERLPLNEQTVFLQTYFNNAQQGRFPCFTLEGEAGDKTRFDCDNIILTSLKPEDVLAEGYRESDEAPRYVCTMGPHAAYSLARITMAASHEKDRDDSEGQKREVLPAVLWRIKGFDSFRPLSAKCPLGEVEMAGGVDMNGKDQLSGILRMCASSAPPDVNKWRQQADALCRHVHHIMSFAACTMLGVPIREFHHGDTVVIEVYSKSGQQRSETPVFHYLDLQPIFDCAVRSHFEPAFDVTNLNFAIQWFVMRGDYRESKLITSMTVLENLSDSNLTDNDTKILSDKVFEKLRKKLSGVLKELAPEWSDNEEGQKAYIKEFNDRFSDLKRRSLMDKISLLAERWGVDLSGVPEEFIKEAKRARDQVVHRGQFQPKEGAARDLHDHVVTVREVVVRFILTILRFEGMYLSYLGGYQTRTFKRGAPVLGHNAGAPVPSAY